MSAEVRGGGLIQSHIAGDGHAAAGRRGAVDRGVEYLRVIRQLHARAAGRHAGHVHAGGGAGQLHAGSVHRRPGYGGVVIRAGQIALNRRSVAGAGRMAGQNRSIRSVNRTRYHNAAAVHCCAGDGSTGDGEVAGSVKHHAGARTLPDCAVYRAVNGHVAAGKGNGCVTAVGPSVQRHVGQGGLAAVGRHGDPRAGLAGPGDGG
ncbi:TPA: hypothetical protein ACLGU7_005086, partial [Salmonella enterica]